MRVGTALLFVLAAVGFPHAATGYTGAQDSNPSNTIPATIKECETTIPNPLHQKNCGTLTWNGQQYDAQWNGVEGFGTKGPATTATVTISFDNDGGVRLDRTDTAGTSYTATYNGKIAAGNTISGSVTWYNNGFILWKGKWSGTVTMPAPQAAESPAPGPPTPPTPPATVPTPMPAVPPPPPPPDAPAPTIELGQTVDQVVAGSGQPTKILKPSASKQIYVYKDMRVTFTNGKVTGIE
jgi:hypothetical protein